MAEEKKYTIWNGNDWATNNVFKEDPLRLIDVSNDVQLAADLINGNPDGEKQRAAKNFEHMMGASGYTPKEVVFNTLTNVAPDVVSGALFNGVKALYKGGKATKRGIGALIGKIKNKAIKKNTSKANKMLLEALEEGKKVDKKYFQNNAAIKNLNETLGDEGAYKMIKDSAISQMESAAPTNKIVKQNLGIRGKNDFADVLIEPFLKEDDYLKNITHDNAKFLLGNAGERLDLDNTGKTLEDTIKVTDDIMKNSNQTGIFQDVVRINNDAFARNSKRIEDAYKSGKINYHKKWELKQLNKINYYNASSHIINDTLIKEATPMLNPIKLFGGKIEIPRGGKITYINDFDMVRPFKQMPEKSKAKSFWKYAQGGLIDTWKTSKEPIFRTLAKYVTTKASKTADNVIFPIIADIVHADMDNPNRYNEADIMDAWELIKRDNAAGLLKDRGGKPLVIPKKPTIREMIDFIKRGTPEADKKRWYEEIQNNRINRLKEEYMDPEFIKEYNIDKMSNKELIDFLSNSSLVDDNDREEIKNNYNLFIKKPKEEK